MKAMLLDRPNSIEEKPLRLAEIEDPSPGPAEVRIRVHCCAICRTDLHVIEGDLPAVKAPVIPGHQTIGTIDRLGEGCGKLRLGQRVGIAWLRDTCGVCEFCTSGKENLCERPRFTGYHEDGGYAEYAIVREDFAYEIPEEMDDLTAAPLLCAGIIGYRALKRSRILETARHRRLGILGFGSSAHIVIQLARHYGHEVFVVTRAERHRELATDLGATWAGTSTKELPAKLDGLITFAPVGSVIPEALEALNRGGTLTIAGIHLTPIPGLDYERHLFYEKELRSVTANTREDGRELLTVAREANVRTSVRPYPLSAANEALQDLKNDKISGTGVLLIPRS